VSDDVLKLSQPGSCHSIVCLTKRQYLKKINRKYHFSRRQRRKILRQKTDTGTTTEATEPFEVDDDVSHEASENKE
jgi:hypothetical protein